MLAYIRKITRHARDRGASAVEYGLLVAAIAAVIVGVVFGLGALIQEKFQDTKDCVGGAAASTDPKCNPPVPTGT